MCRHLAYLGRPRSLAELLVDPPHGLVRQSWAPRRQRHGVVNADGFGVGWYADGDPVPARYRRDRPIWSDANLPELARVVRSGAVMAAVRSGTDGMGHAEAAAAPFRDGPWLFSHNGAVPGWPHSLTAVAERLPAADLATLDAGTDSALIWAAIRFALRGGASLADALCQTVRVVLESAPDARLNFLATDGRAIAATTVGDTLTYRVEPDGSTVVASEPTDDEPGWRDVPDRSLLLASNGEVLLTLL